jgi:hypothetical protein
MQYKEFNTLIGNQFRDVTNERFADVKNYETIGLAYFEKQ